MKTAIVLGAGGFIGNHLVSQLKREGYWVRGVDLKHPDFSESKADEFLILDLRDPVNVFQALTVPAGLATLEIYQLAADMGGAGYIFTGENDLDIMHNSAQINLNVAAYLNAYKTPCKLFYSSSACIYPQENQQDPNNPICTEDSAYPANPDSEYGWEKLFSERLYKALQANTDNRVVTRVARFHNIYGPLGTFEGGKEKAPAALLRKAIKASPGGEIEVWGDGSQTRSFMYISDCVEAVRLFMNLPQSITPVVNIGSEEMVSIKQLAEKAIRISGNDITIKFVPGPEGVRGRNSDNTLFNSMFPGKEPMKYTSLDTGLEETAKFILRRCLI